jgi:hypothetical protein
LIAKDLGIKTEKAIIPIDSEESLKNTIKSKEIVIFDLEFSEIWLEVEMTLESNQKNCKLSFEIKVRIDSLITRLKDILIKMGIKSWINFVSDGEINADQLDYYIFTSFTLSSYDGREIQFDNFYRNLIF